MKLVFMLEELSMKYLLDELLPHVLPKNVEYQTIAHNGKSALRKSLPIKLRGWNEPNVSFVVVHDQDNHQDCIALKNELANLCNISNRKVLVRIACQELEAWYFGDMQALGSAYGVSKISAFRNKRQLTIPDKIPNPKEALRKYIPEYQPINGARRIAKFMDIDNNTSASFQVFLNGVRNFAGT